MVPAPDVDALVRSFTRDMARAVAREVRAQASAELTERRPLHSMAPQAVSVHGPETRLPGAGTERRPVFVDVFAGCGGFSLGLLQAGLNGLFAVERDAFAFETLQANLLSEAARYSFQWPSWLPRAPIAIARLLTAHRANLELLRGQIDVLVGGPPCQGFSSAGRRRRNDPRNKLCDSYIQLVDVLQPKLVIVENVRGFTIDFAAKGGAHNFAARLKATLSERYDVYDRLLDLSTFGVPQSRTRYFLIASAPGLTLRDPFDWLEAHREYFLRLLGLTAPVSSQEAICDLERAQAGVQASAECPRFKELGKPSPNTVFQKLMQDGAVGCTDLRLANHRPAIVRRFRSIIRYSRERGRLNVSIDSNLRKRYQLKKHALRVLDSASPAPTVTSMPDDLLHYSEPRTLTVRENARLQTFPDWYEFRGKYTTGGHLRRKEVPRFTQVANAVPPLVARALGELAMHVLGGATCCTTGAQRDE